MLWENGLFVYRTGRPLPLRVVDDAIRQVREKGHSTSWASILEVVLRELCSGSGLLR
jgi:hypothetical protein